MAKRIEFVAVLVFPGAMKMMASPFGGGGSGVS
jgi:hypothetical protein